MNRDVMKPGWALGVGLAFWGALAHAELLVEQEQQSAVTSIDSPAEVTNEASAEESAVKVRTGVAPKTVVIAPSSSGVSPVVAAAPATAPIPIQIVQAPPAPVAPAAPQAYPVIINTAPAAAPVFSQAAAPIAPTAASSGAAVADASLSRTELMRRERMREELRNEDLLQERLEDLRLQDEKRRTGQLAGAVTPAPTVAPATALMPSSMTVAPVSPVVEQQVVSVPVSDSSAVGAVSTVKLADSSGGLSAASPDEALTMRLSPRGGLASFVGSNAYALEGRYTVGLGIDLGISEHLGFELGYAYSDFGLALNDATAQALAWYMNPYGFSYGGADNPTGALRQNVIDGGIKLHLLGTASRIRPFIGGGAGYSKSFLNYDSRILNFLRQYGYGVPPDYELSQFLAYASAGVEVQVSKKVSIGANFRHYSVLSSRQNQNLNNLALYGPYPGALNTGFSGAPSPTQQFVGGSLANTSFQSVTATVSFAF